MTKETANSHRIRRHSIPEALTESLRERILDGEFREGDALVQELIAQEYETSRMPVREALRQLEAAGLVIMRLHRGAVVTGLPTEQIAELFDLREMLECDALRRSIPHLSAEHLAKASEIERDLERAYRTEDVALWGRLNWEFHRTLYSAGNRVKTLGILEGINLQVDRYIRLHLSLTRAMGQAEKEHRELLRLCSQHDVRAAVLHLRHHITSTGRTLIAAIKRSRRAEAA
jgi:DNA-binding GntR family transcriptional regulator